MRIGKTIISVAKWYMRRGRITKALIIAAMFLPLFIYSYMQANTYVSNYLTQPTHTSNVAPGLGLPRTPCRSLFSGKTLFILGTLAVPSECFVYNGTTLLYEEWGDFSVIYINGFVEQPVGVVLSVPVNSSFTIGNTTIRVVRAIVVIYQNSTEIDYATVKNVLEQYRLKDEFCTYITYSKVQCDRKTAEQLYRYVCAPR